MPRALKETPSSVVVITSDMIEASAASRIDDLFENIPNVQVGAGEEGPAIRGQDSTGVLRNLFAFLGGTRPRTTMTVDGRPVSYNEYVSSSASAWDVERVEFFRSPQTTTQGRNSIAGAIFVETEDPDFTWEGRGRLVAGSFHTRQASALVSGPLIADQLAFRVSGDLRLSRMASDMADGISGADIDRDDYGTVRAKLLFTPAAVPGLRIETTFAHLQSQAPQFEGVRAPFKKRRNPLFDQTNGIMRVNVDSLTTRALATFGGDWSGTLTLSVGDVDWRRFGLPGLGNTRVDNQDRSGEAILRWQPQGSLQLHGGIHAIATRQDQRIDITGLGIGKGGFDDRQRSIGLFGEATWRPVPRITVIAGLRYQRDHQDRKGEVGTAPGGLALDYEKTFDAWLPKLSVAFNFTDQVTGGFLVQRAYNPGGVSFNLQRRSVDPFKEERLRNAELFVRGSFAGGRGSFAANLFYNALRNNQRTLLAPFDLPDGTVTFIPLFDNAPKAETYGLEAEVGWRWSRRLSIRGGVGLLRTDVTETIRPNDSSLGKDFQRSPRFSATASVDWRPLDALRLSANLRHRSGYFSNDANDPLRRVDRATFVDLRAAWAHDRFTLFGYARNAFDTFALNYLYSPTFGVPADPRELGVGIEGRF